MSEKEKQVFYQIESMRDGCTFEILLNYFEKEELKKILDEFESKNYIYYENNFIFINYDKIDIVPWVSVEEK